PAARPPGRAGPVWRGAGRARGRAARRRRAAGSGPEAGRAAARCQQARDATAHRRARAVLRARRDRRAPRPRARRAPGLPERVIAVVERLVRHHLRPMHLGHAAAITPRARYRFYRDLREDTRDLLLLVLADAAAVTGASPLATWRRAGVVRELFAGWSEQREAETRPALLRGEDVMARFSLEPG